MSVFAWGANSHGQLGLGFESEMCSKPQLLRTYSFLPHTVQSVRGGGGHVLILDACGRVHACGWNNRGQLGLDSMQECHNEFKAIPTKFFEDVPIDLIACGWDVSGCITVKRHLYVWGSNAFQQLGVCKRGFTSVRRPMRMHLPHGDTPLQLSLGLRHCAVLTEDCKIYIYGRFRLSDRTPDELSIIRITQSSMVVKMVPRLASEWRISHLASGQNHLLMRLAPAEPGTPNKGALRRIIALGDNKFGQTNAFQFDQEIVQIAAGWTHNATILKDNRILVWGRNCYGQLGMGSFSEQQSTPVELSLSSAIKPAQLHFGSEHALLLSSVGDVFTWGWNEHGNCGIDSMDNLCKPTLVDLPSSCRTASTGAGFCVAICDSAV